MLLDGENTMGSLSIFSEKKLQKESGSDLVKDVEAGDCRAVR